MAQKLGSIYTELSLDARQYLAGMSRVDKFTGTAMANVRRSAYGASSSLDRMMKTFGPTGMLAGQRVFGDLTVQAGALSRIVGLATTAATGLGSALAVGRLTQALDTFTGLKNQVASLGPGFGSASAQLQALSSVADRSRSSLESTVLLYSRLAKADPSRGFERTAQIVETIQKALQLGGATAQESASAAVQFSQAIASNRLGGDELRAVLESPLGLQLAKGLNVTIGRLRELSTQGKLTSDIVLGALEKIAASIDATFAKTTTTIGQQFVVMQNRIIAAAGKIDARFGASRLITSGLQEITDHLDGIVEAAGAAGLALGSVAVGRTGGAGIAALSASLRGLGTDARAGVGAATSELAALENGLKTALLERQKLYALIGPSYTGGRDKISKGLDFNTRMVNEFSNALPRARRELVLAQRAASGFGMALTGARAVGGGLISFLGGPWGAGLAAVAAGVSLIGLKYAEAAQQARNYEEVSARLLNKASETDSLASDLVISDKYRADLEALQSDVDVAKTKLRGLLDPLISIGSEIDALRKDSGEFLKFPGATQAVSFLSAQIDKLADGGSVKNFNAALDAFQRRYSMPTVPGGLFVDIRGQVDSATEALKVLSIAQENYNKKLGEGAQLAGVPSPDVAAASVTDNQNRVAKITAASALFALRVDSIKSREQKIADSLTEAVTKAGYTVNAGLKKFIDGLAQSQALADQISVSSIASQQPFATSQNPHLRYPPGKGPNAVAERGNQSILLAQLLQAADQRRELQETASAQRGVIGNTGGLLKSMFGSRADAAEVKGALGGIETDVKKVFTQFSTGKIDAYEAFKQIEAIRGQLVQLGAEPAPLTAFMAQISDAITGIPDLSAQIDALTTKMRALAAASNSVKLPGGAKAVFPPSSSSRSPLSGGGIRGFAGGGMFRVGGAGGIDSQHVHFKASPNETVAVFTPSQLKAIGARFEAAPASSGGNFTVNAPITVNTNGTEISALAKRQIQIDLANAVQAATNRTR